MKHAALALLLVSLFLSDAHAAVANNRGGTTNNDDSCDIGNAPAATLLLPYFEVDPIPGTPTTTTIFTITNVGAQPRVVHVTLWTDAAYPVLTFDLPMDGYDVQAINLHDVIVRGVLPTGPHSRRLRRGQAENCHSLPETVSPAVLAEVRSALTTGRSTSCGTSAIGGTNTNAVGYVTVDVVAFCSTTFPTDRNYHARQLLFDNVLIGDYQQVSPGAAGQFAQGNPMVHLRAVPEGGRAGEAVLTNLPYTFYDRYTAGLTAPFNRTQDRRQPLPSAFAARWVQGPDAAFQTDYKIWREGVTGPEATCSSYRSNSQSNTAMGIRDIVRFDEHENPTTWGFGVIPPGFETFVVLPAVSRTSVASATFPYPSFATGDQGGWMYLALNNSGSAAYSVTTAGVSESVSPTKREFRLGTSTTRGVRQSQNWVVVSMSSAGRYASDLDAAWLGNGCSPSPAKTNGTTNPIAPAPRDTP